MTPSQSRSDDHRPGWRSCPVTTTVVFLAVVGYLVVLAFRDGQDQSTTEALKSAGAVVWQVDGDCPDLAGPFDLWRGEWWRIPLTSLHHAMLWHLFVNVLAITFLGRLIEPQVDRKSFALLILFAVFVLPMPRLFFQSVWSMWLLTRNTCGLSGVAFTLFGFAFALRGDHPEFAKRLTPIVTALFVGGLVVGLFLKPIAAWSVDNLANLCGLLLGWFAGLLLSFRQRIPFGYFLGVTALSTAAVLALVAIMHPTWNGRYQWWQASQASSPDEQRAHLTLAIERDPKLAWPWYLLAEQELEDGQPMQAWNTILLGYQHNKTFSEAKDLSQRIWNRFGTTQERHQALEELRRILPGADLTREQLVPPLSLADHYATTEQPLRAWSSLLGYLDQTPQPSDHQDVERLARLAWSHLKTPDRQAALDVMAERLELRRRDWQKKLIPGQDLIQHYRDAGELIWAWESIVDELHATPDSEELLRIAEDVWNQLPTETRRQRARRKVEQTFGADAIRWKWRLGILEDNVLKSMSLDQSVALPDEFLGEDEFEPNGVPRAKSLLAPPIDAESPESAAIGKSL